MTTTSSSTMPTAEVGAVSFGSPEDTPVRRRFGVPVLEKMFRNLSPIRLSKRTSSPSTSKMKRAWRSTDCAEADRAATLPASATAQVLDHSPAPTDSTDHAAPVTVSGAFSVSDMPSAVKNCELPPRAASSVENLSQPAMTLLTPTDRVPSYTRISCVSHGYANYRSPLVPNSPTFNQRVVTRLSSGGGTPTSATPPSALPRSMVEMRLHKFNSPQSEASASPLSVHTGDSSSRSGPDNNVRALAGQLERLSLQSPSSDTTSTLSSGSMTLPQREEVSVEHGAMQLSDRGKVDAELCVTPVERVAERVLNGGDVVNYGEEVVNHGEGVVNGEAAISNGEPAVNGDGAAVNGDGAAVNGDGAAAVNGKHAAEDMTVNLELEEDNEGVEGKVIVSECGVIAKEVVNGSEPSTGHDWLAVLARERTALRTISDELDTILSDESVPTDVAGDARCAAGKAQLLMGKKMGKFEQLCRDNIKNTTGESGPGEVLTADLAGYWHLVEMEVEDVRSSYKSIVQMKQNGWIAAEAAANGEETKRRPRNKPPPPPPKQSNSSREEAQKRLREAKLAMKAKLQDNAGEDVVLAPPTKKCLETDL